MGKSGPIALVIFIANLGISELTVDTIAST